jgi:hypothetical protein
VPHFSWRYDSGLVMQSDRIWQNTHKVVRHDLPNQIVALQSLLALLKTEEASRLSSDGQEYLRRLTNATQRASDMVRFLKEMSRIDGKTARIEAIALDSLARELQGELLQQHAKIEFVFEWQWQTPTLTADRATFLRAVVELFRCFLSGRGGRCRVSAASQRVAEGVGLEFIVEDGSMSLEGGVTPTPLRWNQHAIEQCTEIILAREWLALSDASVEVIVPGGGGVRFSMLVPNRGFQL